MGTIFERKLNASELARLPQASSAMAEAGLHGRATKFTFLAAFDGTNNDEGNLKLSGDDFRTNVAELRSQAKIASQVDSNIAPAYYPGAGTGGDQGGVLQAGIAPTSAIDAAAERAYLEFKDAAIHYLNSTPGATPADLGVAATGFSRGCAAAIRFTQILNERGLEAEDGSVIAKPGSIPVTGMALMDPVATFVDGPMHIPANVKGQVLAVMAEHENRSDFRPLYFGDDPRVTAVWHPGNHVGVGGGYDPHGTAANVLEGVTRYFQNRGVALEDVAPERRHDPAQPQKLYSEAYATARNGEVIARDNGDPVTRWRLDDPRMGRIEVRPETPPEHRAWLRALEKDLGPQLREAGLDSAQCERLAEACARRAGPHGSLPDSARLLMSKDQSRLGWLDQQGLWNEVWLDQALSEGGQVHGRPATTPSVEATLEIEPMVRSR
jgi:hypothetical protein